jgi:PQQ-dependent dehydrogenase (methanol/ethanol family)
MNRAMTAWCITLIAATVSSGCTFSGSPELGNDQWLSEADRDTANWLMYGRTYAEQRFSPLQQIDETNVTALGLVWSRELPTTRGLEATPLVVNGTLYTTGSWSVVYAIDSRTGEFAWTYDPGVDRSRARVVCCDVVNRGLAFYRNKVYVGTIDGRLVALDAATGSVVWETLTIDLARPNAITGAPRVAEGLVLIGNAGAEYGVRGYVSAYDAESGALRWRTYTVPGDPGKGFESDAMRRAADTWRGEWWVAGGGGTVWEAIVFDPELRLVYVGTGNADPWYRDLRSAQGGDNLYAASIVALRVQDGEHVWHFQTTPGDHWDYDATQPLMLADLDIEGRTRKVLMQANKNAFFYVLDRETGEFISSTPYAEMTWATGADPVTGRPIEAPAAYDGMRPVVVTPDPGGAHNWYPMAFHPGLGLVYVPVRDNTSFLHAPDADWKPGLPIFNAGLDSDYDGPMLEHPDLDKSATGRLLAWNPVGRRAEWVIDFPVLESAGVLATAGNLIFQGRSDGIFAVYRATDGELLWKTDVGTGIMAPPVTYLVDGVQHLTLMAGFGGPPGLLNVPGQGPVKYGYGRILTFALDGNAPLRVTPFGHTAPPVPPLPVTGSPDVIQEGRALYARMCESCHGINAVAGSLPDLRYASAEVHDRFLDIVLGGARVALGMPAFDDLLDEAQASAIQQYVLSRAAGATSARQ